ncbi:pseudomurein-binding repeat-containing protein [Methanothermobacter sp. DP]|uniref:pseudomurein-binding repeat-containing protein n=1 Tax=Methanothermobacter sp. DP TaxID=2998972 RepID=UPI002AA5CBE7|nr:pseudomurein-binding repeat-containing protein [Methanothermobacter sp. DP]
MQLKGIILFMTALVLFSVNISGAAAVDIFLTSDCITGNSSSDIENLNLIKSCIENESEHNVTVDPKAPKPGEGCRAISCAPQGGVAVYLAASCPGAMREVAKLAATTSKGVIFVNTGKLNLKNTYMLRRAWDDNFSTRYFAGIRYPYRFLTSAGVRIIQPNIDCPGASWEEKCRFIASEIMRILNETPGMTQKNGRFYNSKLIAYHSIDPAVMARVADGIHTDLKNGRKLKRTYNGYRPETFLLMVTDYMNGPIRYLKVRGPSNPGVKSTFHGYLSRTQYRKLAADVNRYMRRYLRAPNYVRFENGIIGYRDLLRMYSGITRTHTSSKKMQLPSSVKI